MKSTTRIAAVRRSLRKAEEYYPFFMRKIEGPAEIRALMTYYYHKSVADDQKKLENLLAEQNSQDLDGYL